MLVGNRDWLQPTTFARAVDATLPLGKVYLPDSSYREMTEWVLPPRKLIEFQAAVEPLGKALDGSSPSDNPQFDRLRPFVRAGGSGGTSRRSTPRPTRCTPGCSASRTGSTP